MQKPRSVALNPGVPAWAAVAESVGRAARRAGAPREVPKSWAPYAAEWMKGYDADPV